jgi:copper chaperone CopZ
MKVAILSVLAAATITLSAAAEKSAKITGVHLCCKSCVTGVEKALDKVPGAKADIDSANSTIVLTAPNTAALQKAADALVDAGYFGKSEDPAIKLNASTGAKNQEVKSLKLENVHLCCNKCVKAAQKAIHSVPGVKEDTCAKNATSFDVKGDFNDQAVFTALQNEGLTGKTGN